MKTGNPAISTFCLLAGLISVPSSVSAQVGVDGGPPIANVRQTVANAVEVQLDPTPTNRDVVRIGNDYALGPDDAARGVTVIGANGMIEGRVSRDFVVVLGHAQVASTAIIEGSLVVVGGGVTIASGAVVREDIVVVGGMYDAPPGFAAGRDHVVIGPQVLGGRFAGVFTWISRGLLWGRPIVPSLPWMWALVAIVAFVYLLLNALLDKPVRAAADALAERPLSSLVVGLLVMLLVGPVCVLLGVSVVGIAVIPLVLTALLTGWTLGKLGAARWIGMSLVRQESPDSRAETTRSFLIGSVVVLVTYMIPVLGFITWTLLSVFGLGASTLAFLAAYRKENPAPVRVAPTAVTEAAALVPPFHGVPPMSSDAEAMPAATASPAAVPGAADLAFLPRAGFRDRLAAGVLDLILVTFVWQTLGPIVRNNGVFLLMLAYLIGFWSWKGTTVGGIICQLRVVRTDNQPLNFADALVRGLSSIFSMVVIGIGFLWILKDPDRQAWHDKIAGTYVVKVPRNWPI